MERIKILEWEIEIDKEKTIQHYKSLPLVSNGCCCDECINYVQACDYVPSEFLALTEGLGINLKKAAETFYCADYDDGTCLYWVGCDIIGRIVNGPDRTMKQEKIQVWKEHKTPDRVPDKKTFIKGFDICFYTISPITINGVEFETITLDFEGVFLRIPNRKE